MNQVHIPARSPHTNALITWLATQTGIAVGDGVAPQDVPVGWQGQPGMSAFVPYFVVHSIPGGLLDGPIGDQHADADLVWQVNNHGGNREQAEDVADLARAVLLRRPIPPLDIAGRAVMWIRNEIPAGAARQDKDLPSIWWSFGQYRLGTTPIT